MLYTVINNSLHTSRAPATVAGINLVYESDNGAILERDWHSLMLWDEVCGSGVIVVSANTG